jgi:hypothetical protein
MAFTRRENALQLIADTRSFAHHLYLAHCLWDWSDANGGRAGCKMMNLQQHWDAVMAQLIGIGDELSRFLTLPTTSRSRHRMTAQGRCVAGTFSSGLFYVAVVAWRLSMFSRNLRYPSAVTY